jgi:hypothetical protein
MKTSPTVEEFYETAGQALVAPENYPSAICDHLQQERRAVRQCVHEGGYQAVIEVGCMDGCLHLETLLDLAVNYQGIDLTAEPIARLRRQLRQRFPGQSFPCADVADVCRLDLLAPRLAGDRVLTLFPFNSFGNLAQPEEALRVVAQCGFDALILTSDTGPAATAVRREYYRRCYTKLQIRHDERGVLFRSPEGLSSYAYHQAWLERLCQSCRLRCLTTAFDELSRSYWIRRQSLREE